MWWLFGGLLLFGNFSNKGYNTAETEGEVDRAKVAPFLLRCFINYGEAHKPQSFVARLPRDVHIYTWRDVSLRELTELIKEIDDKARRPDAILDFSLAYPNVKKSNLITIRHIGATTSTRGVFKKRKTDQTRPKKFNERTKLMDINFEIGDYLCVNIL